MPGPGAEDDMRRRSFFSVLISAGAVATGWPAIGRGWFEADPIRPLLASLRHGESAAAVGAVFLRQHPGEADARYLSTTVAADLRCRGCDPLYASRTRIRRAVSEQVHEDFAQGRVVDVDGWVLSATEARLYGLAALAT